MTFGGNSGGGDCAFLAITAHGLHLIVRALCCQSIPQVCGSQQPLLGPSCHRAVYPPHFRHCKAGRHSSPSRFSFFLRQRKTSSWLDVAVAALCCFVHKHIHHRRGECAAAAAEGAHSLCPPFVVSFCFPGCRLFRRRFVEGRMASLLFNGRGPSPSS